MDAESDLYFKASKLVEFLVSWTPQQQGNTTAIAGLAQELWVALYERTYIEEADVVMLQLWLQALQAAGYEFESLQARR